LTTLAAAGSADTWRTLVAGKGLGEDVTNGAAARRVVAAREGGGGGGAAFAPVQNLGADSVALFAIFLGVS